MPTDAGSAMALTRKNFAYLEEAVDYAHLTKLKDGATGFIHSLVIAGWIGADEKQQLETELDEAVEARKRELPVGK